MNTFAVFSAGYEDGMYSQESIWFKTKQEADTFITDSRSRRSDILMWYIFEHHRTF